MHLCVCVHICVDMMTCIHVCMYMCVAAQWVLFDMRMCLFAYEHVYAICIGVCG